jgi:rare lipoprotein A
LRLATAALVAWVVVLAGCASAPPSGGVGPTRPAAATPRSTDPSPERDGPDANPPPNLSSVPDAEPKLEPIRLGGPNKPYQALGQDYVPLTQDRPFSQRGLASWYGRKFHGRRTASGEVYNMYAMTAAHPTLPLPSYVRVRNPANSREVVVRVNDRGPFHGGRIIDLSYTAALKLGVLGVMPVELERITFDDIRTGAWRRDAPAQAQSEQQAGAASVAEAVTLPSAPTAVVPAVMPIAATPPEPEPVASGFWVQLGAFSRRDGADSFHRRVAADVAWLAPLLAVVSDPGLFRLQAGPYANRDEAQGVAQRIREALQLVPVVLERR